MPRSNHYEHVVRAWIRDLKTKTRRRAQRRRVDLHVPSDRRQRDRRRPLV